MNAPLAPRPGEAAFVRLLFTLERLAAALAASAPAGDPEPAVASVKPLVCALIAHLRAAGATRDEVIARLTAAVACATPTALPPRALRARLAAVIAWCEEAYSVDGPVGGSASRR